VAKLKLDVVTAEGVVLSEEVDAVIAPGVLGQLGILPHHTPLVTMLDPGELMVRSGSDEYCLAISGGYLEARPDRVIILADAAERAEDINLERAEAARQRAQERLQQHTQVDTVRAEAALRRSLIRLKVAQKRRKRPTDTTTNV
jgi:F-type H+-transporting ATPase subunit epsilon